MSCDVLGLNLIIVTIALCHNLSILILDGILIIRSRPKDVDHFLLVIGFIACFGRHGMVYEQLVKHLWVVVQNVLLRDVHLVNMLEDAICCIVIFHILYKVIILYCSLPAQMNTFLLFPVIFLLFASLTIQV